MSKDMIMLLIGIFLVLLVLFFMWENKKANKEIDYLDNELNFFKKEKEYYEEAMMVMGSDFTIIFANQTAKKLFNLSMVGKVYKVGEENKLQIESGKRDKFFNILQGLMKSSDNTFKLENVFLTSKGIEKKVNIYIDKTKSDSITCIIDIRKDNIEVSEKNNDNGTIDFLTGLSSQFLALNDINTLVIESKKEQKSFATFLLGLDHFNDIQMTLGLNYTNQILKKIAQHLTDTLDETIQIYRMDADKFMFLVNNLNDANMANTIAREIISAVNSIYAENNDIRLTSSMGIVLYSKGSEHATKLINNVYAALNKAQLQSESNIVLFSEEDNIIHVDEIQMNEEIKRGLSNNEFLLYYQPIFNLEGTKIIGAEALLRWNHPKHGLISADKFIHIAESTGLIVDLSEYVFNKAIEQRERCKTSVNDNFRITINLSFKVMQVEKLLPRLEVLFDKYNVKRDMITLDLIEKDAMENFDKTINDFKLLKEFGLSLSLDHVGAKYSSFKFLNMLPIDIIKIDRSLIFDLTLNSQHQTTVKAIIDLAHTLGYKVVAEGVETSQEAGVLEMLNCDYAQGYLYAKPLPYTELEELLV